MKSVFKYVALLLAGLCISVSCNGNGKASGDIKIKREKQMTTDNNQEKVLIVFFSHAGENYDVGNVKVGNTKLVADEIQRLTGGDEFEIVAEKSYDMP